MTRGASVGCVALVVLVLAAQPARGADGPGAAPASPEDNASASPVPAGSAAPASGPNDALAWTLAGAAGAMGVGAALFGGMALQAQSDFQNTSLERAAADASDRYTRDTAAFATCAALAVAATVASAYLLLRPHADAKAVAAQVGLGRAGFAVVF